MANNNEIEISPFKIGALLLTAIFVLSMVFGTWFTVNQGERVVVLTNGAVSSVKDAGIYFKAPFFQSTEHFTIRTQKARYENFETYSKDIQKANVTATVNYSINPSKVADVYTNLGVDYENKVITPAILSTIKVVFGQYTATESIDSRQKLVKDVLEAVTTKLEPYGIRVENVAVEDISFSKEYNDSVEARMQAEVDVQKAKQTLLQEQIKADIARTQAQGTADAAVMAAKGKAQATALQGDAEAKAINAKGEALRQNSDLVNYTLATQWDGKLPTTMLPNQGLPMIHLPGQGDK